MHLYPSAVLISCHRKYCCSYVILHTLYALRCVCILPPPRQVIDTVHLWSLPGQRKISLRFLAQYLLNISIQGETHDSIEDARIALALYNKVLTYVRGWPARRSDTFSPLLYIRSIAIHSAWRLH